jgi:hypothetical protein
VFSVVLGTEADGIDSEVLETGTVNDVDGTLNE